jgi:hypothetical protein
MEWNYNEGEESYRIPAKHQSTAGWVKKPACK